MQTTMIIRQLGLCDYQQTWEAMRHYTDTRDAASADEIWLLEHPPVFTQGQNGKAEHVLNPGNIPVIQVDRGGQVTYHGPGQLVGYVLIDLKRLQIGIRPLVNMIEQAIIAVLAGYGVTAANRSDAPGVYIDDAKIASLGLRVRRSCSYHGLAFNINMDLGPFRRINPCGLTGIRMVQLADFNNAAALDKVSAELITELAARLGYHSWENTHERPDFWK
jgi:lipoyl(octanoyl) transferase